MRTATVCSLFFLSLLIFVGCRKAPPPSSPSPVPSSEKIVSPKPENSVLAPTIENSQPKVEVFDPIGKTEDQIIKRFGEPKSRLEVGDELTLVYNDVTYTLNNSLVSQFNKTVFTPSSDLNEASKTMVSAPPSDNDYIQKLQDSLNYEKKRLATTKEEYFKQCTQIDGAASDPTNIEKQRGVHSISKEARDNYSKQISEQKDRLKHQMLDSIENSIKQLQDEIVARQNSK